MIFKRNKTPQDDLFVAWLEFALQWLIENFDKQILNYPVVLPDEPAIQVSWPPTVYEITQVSNFVALRFNENPGQFLINQTVNGAIQFDIDDLSDELRDGSIGELTKIPISQTDPVVDVIKRIAMLSIARSNQKFAWTLGNQESLIELLAILRGLGIILANRASYSDGSLVALPADCVGSAIALVEYAKGQSRQSAPSWKNELKSEAANAMLRMLRYLRTTEPFFGPATINQRKTQPHAMRFGELMRSPRTVDRIIALDWVYTRLPVGEVSIDSVVDALTDKSIDVRVAASGAILHFVQHTHEPIPERVSKVLVKLLEDRDQEIKTNAAFSLSKMNLDSQIVATLCRYVRNSDRNLAYAAVSALVNSQAFSSIVIPQITKALTYYMARGDDGLIENLINTLDELCDNAEEHLVEALDYNEHDFLFSATDVLREIRYAKQDIRDEV